MQHAHNFPCLRAVAETQQHISRMALLVCRKPLYLREEGLRWLCRCYLGSLVTFAAHVGRHGAPWSAARSMLNKGAVNGCFDRLATDRKVFPGIHSARVKAEEQRACHRQERRNRRCAKGSSAYLERRVR